MVLWGFVTKRLTTHERGASREAIVAETVGPRKDWVAWALSMDGTPLRDAGFGLGDSPGIIPLTLCQSLNGE